jgi:hypothetical protein
MKFQKANVDTVKKRIEHYKKKSLSQLQSIIPRWAVGDNADKLMNKELHPIAEEYFVFLVDTKELIEICEFNEVNPHILFTGEMINDGRIATILYHWESYQFVDPPKVEICDRHKSRICFSDGRHRSKTNYLLGIKQMPIAIHKTELRISENCLSLYEYEIKG